MSITNPIQQLTQADLLALLRRNMPEEYLDGLEAVGPGFELLQAFAAIYARVSLAVERLGNDALIDISSEGSRAAGAVELFRDGSATINTPIDGQTGATASIVPGAIAGLMRVTGLTNMSAGSLGRFLDIVGTASIENTGTFEIAVFVDATTVDVINAAAIVPDGNNGTITWEEVSRTVIVKAGTIVTTSVGGKDFVTLTDVTFQPADLGPFAVQIEAVAPGYEWNVPGQVITADGTLLEGEIDTIKVLVEEPPLGDTTIQVRQALDIGGGIDTSLAALGRNRGIIRGDDEDIRSFRERIRRLPDTISPNAVRRVVENLLRPFDTQFEIIETFQVTYQTAWDGPNTTIGESLYSPTLFVYDDPDADGIPFRNRWMDVNDERGGGIVVVENIQPLRDTGMVYDDTVSDVSSLTSSRTGGLRAVSAYDVPQDFGFGAVQGGYDGSDLQKQSLYKGLFDTLQSIKPAGSSVAVERRGE